MQGMHEEGEQGGMGDEQTAEEPEHLLQYQSRAALGVGGELCWTPQAGRTDGCAEVCLHGCGISSSTDTEGNDEKEGLLREVRGREVHVVFKGGTQGGGEDGEIPPSGEGLP